MSEFKATEDIGKELVRIPRGNRGDKLIPLTAEEKKQYKFYFRKITDSIKKKNKATSELVTYVNEFLNKKLWRENYNSPDDFIQDVLKIDESYYYRYAKANRMYLYLNERAKDNCEKITLGLISETVYREIRLCATDRINNMTLKGETYEERKERLKLAETEQLELIKDFWDKIYPYLKKVKQNQNKILPSDGFMITYIDVRNAASQLSEFLTGYLEEATTKDEEIIKLEKQKNKIDLRLSTGYMWDRYTGVLKIIDGRLIIQNKFNTYDFINEVSDLIKNKVSTVISIRRSNNWI